MQRILAITVGIVALAVVSFWAGFRLWLGQQPTETRLSVEAFTPIEFVGVVWDYYFASPIDDNAGWGRRAHPGRGHSPWVVRSSLDGRPRMLSLALAPDLWLAYSTETAGIHQLWRGSIDFSGPAFDARHGEEPMSRGSAYRIGPAETPWRVREGGEGGDWRPARVRWRGHGYDAATGGVWLRFELIDGRGRSRAVVERPERVRSGGRLGLERHFEVEPGAGLAVGRVLGSDADEVETGTARLHADELLILEARTTRIVEWFDAARTPIERDPDPDLGEDAFAAFDCSTCHDARERVAGPAWGEIARRYRGANRSATEAQLATSIREGSRGRWGFVAMTPHPDLSRDQALALAALVLEAEVIDAAPPDAGGGAPVTVSYDFETEPPPDALHPSLTVSTLDIPEFTPQVGGLAWLPDGRLVVATWDRDGAVFVVEGWGGPAADASAIRIAEGLHEPLGVAVVDGEIYVMQKQEITRLLDHDGDGWTDEYRALTNDWHVTSNFHEFGFGLIPLDGYLYGALSVCVLRGGKSCQLQTPDRGKVFRASLETGAVEFVASGLRTPNGITKTPEGALLVTDNQGDWLPASKLIRVEPGADYGWRPPGQRADPAEVTPPALWLPQHEVGNSPTQPVVLTTGPYAGQVLFGDIYNGGIKRAFLEEVGGQLQGAAFHFTGGLKGPVNRLVEAPDGRLVVGQVGSRGNWGEPGKRWFGLEALRFGDVRAFEPIAVQAIPGGFDVTFGRPLAGDLDLAPEHFRLQHWYYVPAETYGGPKYDVADLPVRRVTVSADRRLASLEVEGLVADRVVYLHFDAAIRSEDGDALWVNEAWYTLNALPGAPPAHAQDAGPPPNTLSDAERVAGWRLLFDGESFDGWKIYGADSDRIEGWVVEDGTLAFTRDVSFAGLVWNHINPFTPGALDLMTKERFGSFELSIDWKVSPGGNSGIFYLVPDEEAALSWTYAPEMQVLDDARHADGQLDKRRAGDLYDVVAGARQMARTAGEWNTARIVVRGDRIEHWLNGHRLLAITRGSPAWENAVAASKHTGVEGFARASEGHITLQDHGNRVWYRNVKVRTLAAGGAHGAFTAPGRGPSAAVATEGEGSS